MSADRIELAHGLLFAKEMVLSLLSGKKSMTRRLVSRFNSTVDGPTRASAALWERLDLENAFVDKEFPGKPCLLTGEKGSQPTSNRSGKLHRVYPFIHAGDEVWARETWRTHERPEDLVDGILFAADGAFVAIANTQQAADAWVVAHRNGRRGDFWRSPIHLPRWASRIVRPVAGVKIERVQDISEADIVAEGVTVDVAAKMTGIPWSSIPTLDHAWRYGWEHINGLESWKANPWVFGYSIPPPRTP